MMLLIKDVDNPEQATKDMIASSAFAEMDENSDGKITADEFVTACLAQDRFSKMLALKIIDIFVDDE
jgi:Ca2+-binding EF-hand superfamily protein